VDADAHRDRRVVTEEPRPRLDVLVRQKIRWRFERVGLAELDVAVDAVGAKRADRIAVAVEPDEVPVTPLRGKAPWLDRPDAVAVRESNHGPGAERFEEGRERR